MIGVVFSKDRPLQLDACLSSFARHCADPRSLDLHVLYKASTATQAWLYQTLATAHPAVRFVVQQQFKSDLLGLIEGSEQVLFLVDDNLFIRGFRLAAIAERLSATPEALGFSLRLGRNTTYCYSLDQPQILPELVQIDRAFLKFSWPGASCDFGYPLELSSSLYRTRDLLPLLRQLRYDNPNRLEAELANRTGVFAASAPALLCPEQSLAFCAPINMVQDVCANRVGQHSGYSAESLAQRFATGDRIDVAALDGFVPKACHEEIDLTFVRGPRPKPLVSVVIPCYKQAHFLPEAVESVVAQVFEGWEIVIVDDGSPDDTLDVARALEAQYPDRRMRVVRQMNGGLARARNAGIALAVGQYILPLDADDKLDPALLAAMVQLLEADPTIDIAYCDVAHFGEVTKTIQAAEFDPQLICANNQLNYCSLYRREMWEAIGGYNPNMVWGYEDWEFWVNAAKHGYWAQRIPGALLHYRVRTASMYTEALAHDSEMRAQIVLNNREIYARLAVEQARVAVAKNPPSRAQRVSVIVPTFNRPELLRDAIQSIADQTFEDWEAIVVNDAGADVWEVLEPFAAAHRIVYLRHARNKGPAAARNTGLRFATGEYIAYLDDDDLFYPEHLEVLLGAAQGGNQLCVYADAYCATQASRENGHAIEKREVLYDHDFSRDELLVRNLFPTLCVLHPRECVRRAGFFDETLMTHEDWEYWLRLSRHFEFLHVRRVTSEFRVRSDRSGLTGEKRADFLRTALIIYRRYRVLPLLKRQVWRKRKLFLEGLRAEIDSLPRGGSGVESPHVDQRNGAPVRSCAKLRGMVMNYPATQRQVAPMR